MSADSIPQGGAQPRRSERSVIGRLWSFAAGCLGVFVLCALLVVIASWFVGEASLWWQRLSWVPMISMVPALGLALLFALVVRGWFGRALRVLLGLGLLFVSCWVCGVDYGVLRTRPARADDGTLVHWNAGSLWGIKATAGVVQDMIALEPDLLVITNPGSRLWTDASKEYRERWDYVARNHAALVMSRYPIRECRLILATKGIQVVKIVVQLQGDWVEIWAVDLPSQPDLIRSELFQHLRTSLDSLQLDPPDIVLGDFNVPRNSVSLHRSFPLMRNAFDTVGVGWHGTWPSGFPLWQLDQVLLGPRIEGVRYQIFPTSHGAHRIQQAVVRSAETWVDSAG